MGNETSKQPDSFKLEPYFVLDNTNDDPALAPKTTDLQFSPSLKLLNVGFQVTWTNYMPNCIPPVSRSMHFSVFVPSLNAMIIGYGIDRNDNLLNDIWIFYIEKKMWQNINGKQSNQLDTSKITPRNGTTACLVNDNYIFLFGGFTGTYYIDDLHVIDLRNCKIFKPAAMNQGPPGRIGHVMESQNNKIVIWGGYNGDWLSDLWILDINTNSPQLQLQWRHLPCDINNRTSAAYVNDSFGENLYIYGASKTDPFLKFNWESEVLSLVKSSGTPPSSQITAGSMLAVGKYLFVFGGKFDKHKYCLLYGYDIRRNWWFQFSAKPDGITTTVDDGAVDKNGLFYLPRTWSSSIAYNRKTREALLFLGLPSQESPPISIINLEDLLSGLNLASDLLQFLR